MACSCTRGGSEGRGPGWTFGEAGLCGLLSSARGSSLPTLTQHSGELVAEHMFDSVLYQLPGRQLSFPGPQFPLLGNRAMLDEIGVQDLWPEQWLEGESARRCLPKSSAAPGQVGSRVREGLLPCPPHPPPRAHSIPLAPKLCVPPLLRASPSCSFG